MKNLPNRRTILAAMGGLTTLAGIGSATDETRTTPECDPDPSEHGLTTLACDEHPPEDGKIELCNCSPCARTVNISVTGRLLDTDEGHVSNGALTVHLYPRQVRTFYYSGSLDELDMTEPGDINVAISQRTIDQSNASHCQRRCDRC